VGLDDRAGILGLSGYPVLPLLLLALAMGGAVLWLRRRLAPSTPRFSPAWNDGLAPPPAWLPFGDPLTQTAGEGFLPPLPRLPGRGGLRRIRHIRRIAALPALLTAMAVLLAALLWVGSA
jgi:hypothetical protein